MHVPQIVYEFWVVALRPVEARGLGLSVLQTKTELSRIQKIFTLLKDERAVFGYWEQIVAEHDVKGKLAHDARRVAAMQRHAIPGLLTFNSADFGRVTDITVRSPRDFG